MATLRFRAPGTPIAAAALLARALPSLSTAEAERQVRAGALGLAHAPGDADRAGALEDPRARVAPGTALRLRVAGASPEPEPPVRPGPLEALAPALAWRRGRLEDGSGAALDFEALEERDGVVRYRLTPAPGAEAVDPAAARALLAGAGAPLLGDLRHGGVLVAGGLRLAAAGEPPWPAAPVLPPASAWPPLAVSPATLRAVRRGHPWVLRDAGTADTGGLPPGALVALAGERAVQVRLEPRGPVAARVWSRAEAGGAGKPASIEARVAAALRRRSKLRAADSGTDAFRLLHGEADGLPGLALDRLGPLLRLAVVARCAEPLVTRVLDAAVGGLRDELGPDPTVLQVLLLRDPPRGRLEAVCRLRGPEPALDARGRLEVRERGLRFQVDPGLADPGRPRAGVGLFLDQRDNRSRVAARARADGRYLNLFAHTGAFSAALLAAGAARVTSVDLSAAYLRWLEANLEANGLAGSRHRSVRSDGRRFLERLDPAERFAGVVLDPPTAAAAGRRFWSVKRDLEPLAAAALGRVEPGGWLLLTRNDRRAAGAGPAWIEGVARRAGVTLGRVEAAGPGPDFPPLAAFPEGEPFRGWLVSRS